MHRNRPRGTPKHCKDHLYCGKRQIKWWSSSDHICLGPGLATVLMHAKSLFFFLQRFVKSSRCKICSMPWLISGITWERHLKGHLFEITKMHWIPICELQDSPGIAFLHEAAIHSTVCRYVQALLLLPWSTPGSHREAAVQSKADRTVRLTWVVYYTLLILFYL